jgi:hypothetical protein
MMTPLLGWLPDADPTKPGIVMDCQHFQPSAHGYIGAPAPIAAASAPLPSDCRGAAVVTRLDGQRRVIAGTQTKLYQDVSNAWVDFSGGAMAAPVQSAAATATTGGTLAAGTYFYVITALNALGETVASNEVSITTTGTTSKNTLTWAAVTGATGYRVYRGAAAGAENVYYAPGNVLTMADTGAAGTAGHAPAQNTSGGYVGSSESRWSICQFGDTTMASNYADPMQSSSAVSTPFAAIAGAPKAKIIVSQSNNFVVAFNTNEATNGVSPDRWWCCAQNDQTNWTPNVSTGANTGRLIAGEGAITAATRLGDYLVAYKLNALFLGTFVGSPVAFQWTLIPGGPAGCVGQDALCDIGGAIFSVGADSFWIFDGTRPMPIGAGETRMFFYNGSNPSFRYRTQCAFDARANLVRVFYPSTASTGQLDSCITYSTISRQWGRDDQVVQAALNFIQPGTTIDGLDNYASTIDTLPNIPVDSPFWLAGGQVPSVFNGSAQLVSLNGVPLGSMMTTGDLGDDDQVTMLNRFRVRYSLSPATAMATGLSKFNEGDPLLPGPINAINDGKFDLRQSARFHRVRVDMTGSHRMTAYEGIPIPAGQR